MSKISVSEYDFCLAQRTFGLLLDPLIHAEQVKEVHALDFGQFLALQHWVQTYGTVLLLHWRG